MLIFSTKDLCRFKAIKVRLMKYRSNSENKLTVSYFFGTPLLNHMTCTASCVTGTYSFAMNRVVTANQPPVVMCGKDQTFISPRFALQTFSIKNMILLPFRTSTAEKADSTRTTSTMINIF